MNSKTNHITAHIGTTPYATECRTGNHVFIADEPMGEGGADKGPKPHDLLAAALASCTCITIRMYADRKGWKLESVDVDVKLTRTTEIGILFTHAEQVVRVKGDLDDVMKQRLGQIGAKCPVHKTLAPAIAIETVMR